jgi:hypothetical protein
MQCRLCLNEQSKLKKSHIIPECFYDEIYDEKHRFTPISGTNYQQLEIEQKGIREEMLCGQCEQKLGNWENNTKKDLVDIASASSNYLNISPLNNGHLLVEDVNHDSFKKCILSILWRMSVASHKMFSAYSLGKYQEVIRELLDQNTPIGTFDYPIIIKKVTLNNKHYKDLILCMGKGHIDGRIIQSFIAYGYLFDVFISNQKVKSEWEVLLLTDLGRMVVGNIDSRELPQDQEMIQRFKQDDVINFFNKS